MDGVTGLEADHLLPALVGQECFALPVEGSDTGMLGVGCAVDELSLALPIVGVAILDEHGGHDLSVAIGEGYLLAYRVRLILADGERDRHAPHQAAGEAHTVDDGLVVFADHEARKGREYAACDHLEVRERPRAERNLAQFFSP